MKKDTKKFIMRGIIFFLICFSPLIVHLLFPIEHFTFRVWESVSTYRLNKHKPFYSNMNIDKIEEGNIAYRTEHAVKNPVTWVTDRYGYRNYPDEGQDWDVVIIGDSMIGGAGLNQHEMLNNIIQAKTTKSTYALATATVSDYLMDPRFEDNPPELVILEMSERRIDWLTAINENITVKKRGSSILVLETAIDRLDYQLKLSLFRYIGSVVKNHYFPRKIFVHEPSGMVFTSIPLPDQDMAEDEIEDYVSIVKGHQDYFENKGIDFIYLPIPDKNNIYYERLPDDYPQEEPTLLAELISRLKSENIPVIDTVNAFEEESRNQEIYMLDDTHWNPAGVNITADLLIEEMQLE